MVVIGLACGGDCCAVTFCDFMRSGGLNGYYIEIGVAPGTFTSNVCSECESFAGTFKLCCAEFFSGDPNPPNENQVLWGRYSGLLVPVCVPGPPLADSWMMAAGSVSCSNGEVTVSVVFFIVNTLEDTPGACGETFSSSMWHVEFRATLTEAEFETYLANLETSQVNVPWYFTNAGGGNCDVDTGDIITFRLVDNCSTTTTTTTPTLWYCVDRANDAAINNECLQTICEQMDDSQVAFCLSSDPDCFICDIPFASQAECEASTYCLETTTTTTTTTPLPWYCCGDAGDDCYGTVTCLQGGPCEAGEPARPNCGGPYDSSIECEAACTSLTTTTTPDCTTLEADDDCDDNCVMTCPSGTYNAPVWFFGPPCICNPSPEDTALIGQPCTGARAVPACNPCSNATTENTCP